MESHDSPSDKPVEQQPTDTPAPTPVPAASEPGSAPVAEGGAAAPVVEPPGTGDQPSVVTAPHQATAKKSKKMLIMILVAVLVLAGAAAAYFMLKPKPAAKSAVVVVKDIPQLNLGTIQSPVDNFFPDPNSFYGASYSLNLQVYEGLVGYKDANKVVPLLAESWTNPDNSTWVFKLKSGVKFQNGKTMTADDVKTSIENDIKEPGEPSIFTDTIDTVTVQDPTHVVIKTKTPDAILLNKLAFLFITSSDKIGGQLAGTGAYKVDDTFKPTDTEIHLVAFDGYHGGRPVTRKLNFLGYDDDTAMQKALTDKKIDISDSFKTSSAELPATIAGYTKSTLKSGDITYFGINALDKKSPLNKLAVRQALQMSIDSAAYIKATGSDGDTATQMTTVNNIGYNPAIKPITRNVTQAKALLKSAGYPNGVTLTYSFGENAQNQKSFDELKKEVADSGITLVADSVKDGDTFFGDVDAGKYQLFQESVISVLADSYDIFAFSFNSKNYDNPTLDAALATSNQTFDATKRKTQMQAASKLLIDDVAAVPLFENISTYYVRSDLNYHVDPTGYAFGGYVRTITVK